MNLNVHTIHELVAGHKLLAQQRIDDLHQLNREAANGIDELAGLRARAFSDLARHYLPKLTPETLESSWREVRQQIRRELLLRDGQCRELTRQIESIQRQLDSIGESLTQTRNDHEQARLDLLSKTGNFHKELREDSTVQEYLRDIDQVDNEIDHAIELLEWAKQEAQEKLPSFEESTLFSYLQECRFGTPEYTGKGLQRRWDRWVAKLIDYDQSKRSYDHLRTSPEGLEDLVEQKRQAYQKLIDRLNAARSKVSEKYQVESQRKKWMALGERVESLQQEYDSLLVKRSEPFAELQRIQDVQGEHYQRALAIYRDFLNQLDTDTLDLYSQITDSRIDDEICARISKFQRQREQHEKTTSQRDEEILQLRKFQSGLDELDWRIDHLVRKSVTEVSISQQFPLQSRLEEMKTQTITPGELWQQLRVAMNVGDAHRLTRMPAGTPDDPIVATLVYPLEATLMAPSADSGFVEAHRLTDPLDIVLVDPDDEVERRRMSMVGFQMLAFCQDLADAEFVSTLLDDHRIYNFIHDQPYSNATTILGANVRDDAIVLVDPKHFDEAHRLIRGIQLEQQRPWKCRSCQSGVDQGYLICWSCGSHRSIDVSRN